MFNFLGILIKWDLFTYLYGAMTLYGIMNLIKMFLFKR